MMEMSLASWDRVAGVEGVEDYGGTVSVSGAERRQENETHLAVSTLVESEEVVGL